ncbi:MAG: hypothetical protein Q9160_002415 [Pyrenula sp. 1 TL-2023]
MHPTTLLPPPLLLLFLSALTSPTHAHPIFSSLAAGSHPFLPSPPLPPRSDLLPRAIDKSGTMTFFSPDVSSSPTNPTACNTAPSSSDPIVALSSSEFSADKCGKSVTIQANGKSATATVGDKFAGAPGAEDIDVSEGVFTQLADLEVGRVAVTWGFD